MQEEQIREGFALVCEDALVDVDRHELPMRNLEFMGDVAPDTAEAADDVVLPELTDLLFHASSPQGVVEVPLEEKYGETGEQKGDCAEACQ